MPPSHQYHKRDYEFANTFVTLRTTVGLTQQGLAKHLGVSSRAVENWEQGLTAPKAEHLKAFLALCVRASAFAIGREQEQIRALWKAARQKVLLDEVWLSELLARTSPSSTKGAGEPSPGSEQDYTVASKSLALWMVPYIRNPHFTGRDDLLSHLEQQFARPSAQEPTIIRHAALTQSQAIKGLGGIGKTQTAIEYAYRAREQGRYTHTLWISAQSEETVLASFAALKDWVPTLRHEEESDQHALVKQALRWLEQCPEPWLLIYDNADDITFLPAYLPTQGQGSILLTTRTSAVGTLAPSLEVDALPLEEGVQFLLRRAGRENDVTEEEREEASAIVQALGLFPLAIDQAGAYLEETGCSLADYLQIYQQHQYQLLAQRGKQASGYPDTVATTWSLAFEQIEERNKAAAELLQLCAFLAPDQIPEELLTLGAAYWPAALQAAVKDRFHFNQILSPLLDFSLIKRVGREHMLSVHRLVQVVQRERMTPEEQGQWAERVVYAINVVFPRDPENEVLSWSTCQRLLEQALACDTLIQQYRVLFPEAAAILRRTGVYLREHALYPQAEPLLQQACALREHLLGAEHLDIAQSLEDLATLYRLQGRYPQAEPLFQKALSLREQQLGPEHLDTAESLNNLAILYFNQGKYDQADPLHQRALSLREQQLGPEHDRTVESLNNLAILYDRQGKYDQAEPLHQRVLSLREQQLGPTHLYVAIALNNLAALYRDQGKYTPAEPLYQRALRIYEQHLGPEHPDVAIALNNLALLYSTQGKYMQAEPLFQRALRIREQHLGPEHFSLALSLNNLGFFYNVQGKYMQAELLFQRALHIYEQHLGDVHPDVALALNNLGFLYYQQGKYMQAEPLFQRALHIYEQHLGSTHPGMAFPLHGLAIVAAKQGKYEESERLDRQALRIFEEQVGPEHPYTAYPLHGLALLFATLGQERLAEAFFQRALHVREQHLGPEHLETANVLHDFAGFRLAQGKITEATGLYQRTLAIRENVLGADNPLTTDTRDRLHEVLVALGQAPETTPTET